MKFRPLKSIHLLFLLLLIVEVIFILVINYTYNSLFAVKSVYVLLATIVWYLVWFRFDKEWKLYNLHKYKSLKVVLLIFVCSILSSVYFGSRFSILVISYTLGSFVILITDRHNHNGDNIILLEAIIVMSIFPILKFIDTSFYVGNSDIIAHVEYAQRILYTGDTELIEGLYSTFPGFHVLVAEISYISDIPPYSAIFLLGVIILSMLVLTTYEISKLLFGIDTGIYSVVGLLFMDFLYYYSYYTIPQTLSTPIIFIGIYMLISANDHRRYLIAILACLPLIVVHHLTFLLMLPIAFWILIHSIKLKRTAYWLITVLVCSPIIYWVFNGELFLLGVYSRVENTYRNFSGISEDAITRSNYYFGVDPEIQTIHTSLRWLYTFDGIHHITLLAIFCSATLAIYKKRQDKSTILLLSPILMASLFKTPILIPKRVIAPACIIYSIYIGVGMKESNRSLFPAKNTLFTFVLVVCMLSSPLALADTLPNLRPDQSSYSDTQNQITQEELSTVTHLEKYATQPISTLWLQARLIKDSRKVTYEQPVINKDKITSPSALFFYSNEWSGKTMNYAQNNSFGNIIISKDWLSKKTEENNKIFTNGNSGVLYPIQTNEQSS